VQGTEKNISHTFLFSDTQEECTVGNQNFSDFNLFYKKTLPLSSTTSFTHASSEATEVPVSGRASFKCEKVTVTF